MVFIQVKLSIVKFYRNFSRYNFKKLIRTLILEEDCSYTAFKADGGLCQLNHMSFGLTNGVACFQKSMHNFISDEKLDTFTFMDNIARCCMRQNDHDENLLKFQEAARC